MANIYIRDEVLTELDKQCETPKGTIDRSDFIKYMLDKEKNASKK
jgi:hypothetical protein